MEYNLIKKARRLEGRVAVVTGAGGGIRGGMGPVIARHLAAEGARVVINDLTPELTAKTVELIQADGNEAFGICGSVGVSQEATALIDETVSHYGQIDILVNNAGISGKPGLVETLTDENWQNVLNVNLNGTFYTCRAAIRHMRPRTYGRIINVSSLAGIRMSLLGNAAYTTSKAAVLGLTRHMATENAKFGISANVVLPGSVMTPMFVDRTAPEKMPAMHQMAPAMRMALPEDIAMLVCFLATEEAGYITGDQIQVDGAMSALSGNYGSYLANTQKEG